MRLRTGLRSDTLVREVVHRGVDEGAGPDDQRRDMRADLFAVEPVRIVDAGTLTRTGPHDAQDHLIEPWTPTGQFRGDGPSQRLRRRRAQRHASRSGERDVGTHSVELQYHSGARRVRQKAAEEPEDGRQIGIEQVLPLVVVERQRGSASLSP